MWRIGKYWINPKNIAYVYDRLTDGNLIVVMNAAMEQSAISLRFEGEDRQELLNCLAQHTVSFPRLLTDEPPF